MTTSEKCPTCGGPLPEASGSSADEVVCTFCGARVSRKPAVVERVVEHVVFVEREGSGGRTSLVCPRCDVALFEGKAQETALFGCGKCGGVWLDNVGSQRLVNALDQGILSMGDRAAAVTSAAKTNTAPAIACPICREALKRSSFSGVDLDVCAAHGTWFDRGEMRRVAEGIQSARLDAAGGPTHDYEADVRAQADAQTYAKGALTLVGVLLDVAATAALSK